MGGAAQARRLALLCVCLLGWLGCPHRDFVWREAAKPARLGSREAAKGGVEGDKPEGGGGREA